ncbi:pyroglutamyl-peptidase [Isoptericola sp. CG 20/1183]|uniref:Pyroglutamyl-peptidase I n=1 Tax=Isoptericola halotolerans TaxID=300560 RepID=A0ABX5EDN3_9MICO|nr:MULTISPECIES: pyroglutamyl-peptidase I [Isoptericola]PRZ03465.1 pyroglutamyl-peptidase [Isoptericola sp. CG 20/1183]PRZ03752.1 pyroglutamyl-peptidase [Isoptericola halotolerans]
MKVLVTGFEPFDGAAVNESWEAVRCLRAAWADEQRAEELVVARLPVSFRGAPALLHRLLAEHSPQVVVCVGLAAGSRAVRLERVAVNVVDARIPDAAGRAPVDEPVVADGPVAYLSSLPLKAALASVRGTGVPVAVSNTAGTYVCNATFYALAHALAATDVRAGFVHVPAADVVPVAGSARALAAVVRTAADHRAGRIDDLVLAAGTEH